MGIYSEKRFCFLRSELRVHRGTTSQKKKQKTENRNKTKTCTFGRTCDAREDEASTRLSRFTFPVSVPHPITAVALGPRPAFIGCSTLVGTHKWTPNRNRRIPWAHIWPHEHRRDGTRIWVGDLMVDELGARREG